MILPHFFLSAGLLESINLISWTCLPLRIEILVSISHTRYLLLNISVEPSGEKLVNTQDPTTKRGVATGPSVFQQRFLNFLPRYRFVPS
jgi:hypothetical protein